MQIIFIPVFLLQAIVMSSKIFSPLAPVIPADLRSTNTRCTSVPPVTILYPHFCRPSESRRALATTLEMD